MSLSHLPFPTYSEQPLRVLTPELSRRIADVNLTRTILHALGLRVERQALLAKPRAALFLFRGDAQLRKHATAMSLRNGQYKALICGVDVIWPATATTPEPLQ